MRVIVLGKTGMLGRYVYTYLSNKYDVIGTTRRELDAFDFNKKLLGLPNFREGDVVINCIGLIKQRKGITKAEYIAVNSLFPNIVADYCANNNIKFIHITTDCVYNALSGSYNEDSPHNATDLYGISKSLGEPDNALVIRTSIIGEELSGKASLLEWVKTNAGNVVDGYTNHIWNGITCLQFAKICDSIIEGNFIWQGVRHVYSPTAVDKCELVELISEIFNLGVKVIPSATVTPCDRSLSSKYPIVFDIPEIEDQLKELKKYTKYLIDI